MTALALTSSLVHPGRSVRITETAGDEQTFSTVIDDVREGMVVVQTPTVHNKLVLLPPGSRVSVSLRDGTKTYAFEAEVRDTAAGPPPETLLAPLTDLVAAEQRRYYRLPITIAPSMAEALEPEGPAKPIRALVNDIGGGGLAFISPRRLNAGERVRMVLPLVEGREEFEVEVMVLGVEEPDENRFNYRYHCEFIGMRKWVRERIIRFVFREQLRRLQKGVA